MSARLITPMLLLSLITTLLHMEISRHYVPATSHRVWLGNKRKESDVHINLAGVAVGNGLTNPEIQYKYYPLMVRSNVLFDFHNIVA
jgi:hypothetical protein